MRAQNVSTFVFEHGTWSV